MSNASKPEADEQVLEHTPGKWRVGAPSYRCRLKHYPEGGGHGKSHCIYSSNEWNQWAPYQISVDGDCPDYRFGQDTPSGGEIVGYIGYEEAGVKRLEDANLIALAPTAPHRCNVPDCPGPKNLARLDAAAQMAAMVLYAQSRTPMEHPAYAKYEAALATYHAAQPALEAYLARLDAAAALAMTASGILRHIRELADAWRSGALNETDGQGATRSNRNIDLYIELHAALAAYHAAQTEASPEVNDDN